MRTPISIDVIRTACMAAREYGCEKLWLDRLCILQSSKQDKIWQIKHMFRIYKYSTVCLVFPGGLVRLARLDDSTTWIYRAWTLQEAAAPGMDKIKVVYQLTHPSYHDFISWRCDAEGYDEAFREFLSDDAGEERFVDKILEEGRSAVCDMSRMLLLLWSMDVSMRTYMPKGAYAHAKFPVRILPAPEAKMLDNAIKFDGVPLWIAAYTRSSSRPIDMVFSLMDLLGVQLDVAQFGENERFKATIAMIQALMKKPGAIATWLYIAPTMTPSRALSTLPEFPETSESGKAYIQTPKGRVLAFDAISAGGTNFWRSDGAPAGEMTDSGYFIFWSSGALLVEDHPVSSGRKTDDNHETWAVIVGEFKNFNRNPDTWKRQTWDPNKSPKPKGLVELTLMLIEKHGPDLYHRVGMEREIDDRKTAGWNWQFRRFQVGGPGRGERKRFGISPSGPIYVTHSEEEEDHMTMRIE